MVSIVMSGVIRGLMCTLLLHLEPSLTACTGDSEVCLPAYDRLTHSFIRSVMTEMRKGDCVHACCPAGQPPWSSLRYQRGCTQYVSTTVLRTAGW